MFENTKIEMLNERVTRLEEQLETQRQALALADEFVKWMADNYPKAIREMPTTLYVQMRDAGRALDSFPASEPECDHVWRPVDDTFHVYSCVKCGAASDPASIREEVRAIEGPLSPDELEETVSRALGSFGGSSPAKKP